MGGKKPEIDGLVPTERVPWKIFQERKSLCFLALSVRFLSTSPYTSLVIFASPFKVLMVRKIQNFHTFNVSQY